MISARSLAIAISWVVLSTPLIYAQDLSQYRKLQFGMNLLSVAQQTGMKPSEARTIHQRPALIQELEWRPQHFLGDPSLKTDPVRELLLSFYSDELFRIVVTYDRYRTEGLTDEDMIEALSAKYGPATRPTAKTICFFFVRGLQQHRKGHSLLGRCAVLVQPLPFLLPDSWNPGLFQTAGRPGSGRCCRSYPAGRARGSRTRTRT